jgi:hypothetical protein
MTGVRFDNTDNGVYSRDMTSAPAPNDHLFDAMGRYRRERAIADTVAELDRLDAIDTAVDELDFLDAIVTMTDAELASYRRRYATATDPISVVHGNAVRAEITRRGSKLHNADTVR